MLLEILDIIAQSGVGNAGSSFLIILQIYISLFFELKFLFSSMKKIPIFLAFSIAMIPMLLIATYSIVGGIIFSAFLGEGPKLQEMTALINLTRSESCIFQMLLFVGVFFALTTIYSMVYKLKPISWVITFGIELLAALSLLVLYGGLLIENFPFTILDLCRRDIYLARWIIYGYLLIIFKCFVLLVSLFLGLLLREKKAKREDEEEKYFNRSAYYQKKTLTFLTKNHLLIGISLLIFGVFSVAVTMPGLLQDKTFRWNTETIFLLAFLLAVYSLTPVFSMIYIYRAIRPKSMKAYRQLLQMGEEDTILRMFCEEVIDHHPTEKNLKFNNTEIKTSHFLFMRQGIRTWVKWIGDPLE